MPTGVYIRTEYHNIINRKGHIGKKHTEKTKEKMGISARKNRDNGKLKMPNNNGRKYPPEHCRNISLSLRGNKNWLGKRHSQETKDKLSHLKKGKRPYIITDETRRKMSEKRKGAKCHFWRGGITQKNYTERKIIMELMVYKIWRRKVFERDAYTCIWCGLKGSQHGGYLHADHIKPFAFYPELRFDINNGRTLCRKCHYKTDTFGIKARLRVSEGEAKNLW